MLGSLASQLEQRTGYSDPDGLRYVVTEVARALVVHVGPVSRAALAAAVGGAALDGASATPSPDELVDAALSRTGLHRGAALELVESAVLVLVGALDAETRARLHVEVPASWQPLLDDPHDVPVAHDVAAPIPTAPGGGRTLATGKPGSRHPLAEAAPHPAHTHSIAASDDPHADSRLAETRGISSERDGSTLAAGKATRPGRTDE